MYYIVPIYKVRRASFTLAIFQTKGLQTTFRPGIHVNLFPKRRHSKRLRFLRQKGCSRLPSNFTKIHYCMAHKGEQILNAFEFQSISWLLLEITYVLINSLGMHEGVLWSLSTKLFQEKKCYFPEFVVLGEMCVTTRCYSEWISYYSLTYVKRESSENLRNFLQQFVLFLIIWPNLGGK